VIFKPENFRQLPALEPGKLSEPIDLRDDQSMTLVLVKASGEALFAHSRGGKDDIVRRFDATTDLLLLAWTGRYKTDVFQLSAADIAARYRMPA
jgi:hypothetical protein